MLHLENKTPEYFSENSRDFQLLCRVLNIFLNSSAEQERKIVGNWSIETLDESLLALMARKLGFIEGSYIPPAILRNICKSYPRILKYKGTQQAVREAAYAVLSAHQEVTALNVIYSASTQESDGKYYSDPYIHIECNVTSGDEVYLEKLYPYILPAGVRYDYTLNITRSYGSGTKLTSPVTIGRTRGWGSAISRIIGSKPGSSDIGPKNESSSWSTSLTSGVQGRVYSKVNVGLVVSKLIDENAAVIDASIQDDKDYFYAAVPDQRRPLTAPVISLVSGTTVQIDSIDDNAEIVEVYADGVKIGEVTDQEDNK